MKTKFYVRILVAVTLLAWPAVESYRLYVAKEQLASVQVKHKTVMAKLEASRLASAQASSVTK